MMLVTPLKNPPPPRGPWAAGPRADGGLAEADAEGDGLAWLDAESALAGEELPEVAMAAPPAPASRATAATATRVSGCPYRCLGGGPLAGVTGSM